MPEPDPGGWSCANRTPLTGDRGDPVVGTPALVYLELGAHSRAEEQVTRT